MSSVVENKIFLTKLDAMEGRNTRVNPEDSLKASIYFATTPAVCAIEG